MPNYASVERLKRDHLSQLLTTSEHDGALERCLTDATAIIDLELGYSFAATAASAGRTVYGTGTAYLPLDHDYTSGTPVVTAPAGIDVPDDYVKVGDYLVITDEDGTLSGPYVTGGLAIASSGLVWAKDVKYTVTATYGGVPGPIARLTCELATQLWRFREAGGSDTVGTETAVIQVRAGLTAFQRSILDHYRGSTVGVY